MLIVTRRIGESVAIGDDVTFKILGIQGRYVRVGITAPPEVSVHREEIYQKVQQGKIVDLHEKDRHDEARALEDELEERNEIMEGGNRA